MMQKNFKPKPGQVDFTKARYAPTFNCILKSGDKILLVKRSDRVAFYPGTWNGVSGFLDDKQTVKEKFYEELQEELGFSKNIVSSLKVGKPILEEASEYDKVWLVIPMLAEVEPAKPKLNWEAVEVKWFALDELKEIDLMPGLVPVLKTFFSL